MQSITVTIGRNVPEQAAADARRDGQAHYNEQDVTILNAESWAGFTELIVEALEALPTRLGATESWIETHDGIGEWDGVQEQSRRVTLLHNGGELAGRDLTTLEVTLVLARSGYYQDAVALTFGGATLV